MAMTPTLYGCVAVQVPRTVLMQQVARGKGPIIPLGAGGKAAKRDMSRFDSDSSGSEGEDDAPAARSGSRGSDSGTESESGQDSQSDAEAKGATSDDSDSDSDDGRKRAGSARGREKQRGGRGRGFIRRGERIGQRRTKPNKGGVNQGGISKGSAQKKKLPGRLRKKLAKGRASASGH